MSVTLMTTSTPREGDEENRFPPHYSEADQMARFSSTDGCRYINGKDMIALLAMYIMILHILHPDRQRIRLHHPGANSKVSPSSESWFPQSFRRHFPSCRGVAKFVFRRCGWMSGKTSSLRLPMRITGNPVVRGLKVLATICNSFEGEEINKENIS